MRMTIESAAEGPGRLVVTTTGSEFTLDRAQGIVECVQRIPVRRRVATIRGLDLKGMRLAARDEVQCTIATSAAPAAVVIRHDSLLQIALAAGTEVGIAGHYAPAYVGEEGPHRLLPDEQGGVAAYALGPVRAENPPNWNAGWRLAYRADGPARLWACVFPPRPFDREQSLQTVVHSYSFTHPYPSDGEIRAFREYGTVLTLHSWIWKGDHGAACGIEKDNSWNSAAGEPKSPDELRRVVRTAHAVGMKVIPYLSPFYFGNPAGHMTGANMDAYMTVLERIVRDYGVDGVYLDGIYGEIEAGYEVILRIRRLIGEAGILYVHSTSLPLTTIYCPFLDSHADYLLRGEHTELTREYARWFVSSYNLGNSIGTFCYDQSRVTAERIALLLSVHARLPFWVQDGTWNGIRYHLDDAEKALMLSEYFPRLKTL